MTTTERKTIKELLYATQMHYLALSVAHPTPATIKDVTEGLAISESKLTTLLEEP